MTTDRAFMVRPCWLRRLLGLAQPAGADVKIGILMPLSGKGASYGQHQEIAMKMALEALEKTGIKGEKVEAIVYDTRGENAEAINLTRKLIANDKVLAIIGPFFSAECEVAFPIAVQNKTPIITASSAKPGIAAKNRPWAFRNALSSDQMNGYLLDVWLKRNPVKSVVILTDVKDAFTKVDGTVVFPAELKQKNVQVLDNISYQTGDIDYSAQVTKAKGLNPEGILIAGLYNEGGNIVREIRKQGMTQPIVGALGMSETKFLDIAGPAGDGTTVVNPFWPDDPDPKVHAWAVEYQKRAKVGAGQYGGVDVRHDDADEDLHREVGRHQQAGGSGGRPRAHQGLPRAGEGCPGYRRSDVVQCRRRCAAVCQPCWSPRAASGRRSRTSKC